MTAFVKDSSPNGSTAASPSTISSLPSGDRVGVLLARQAHHVGAVVDRSGRAAALQRLVEEGPSAAAHLEQPVVRGPSDSSARIARKLGQW